MVYLTNNIVKILGDFGKYPKFYGSSRHIHTPYGIFYGLHMHQVVLEYSQYICIKCDQKNCKGYQDKTKKCPYLRNIICSTYKYNDLRLKNMINILLNNGFDYLMVYDEYGKCIYFDEYGTPLI